MDSIFKAMHCFHLRAKHRTISFMVLSVPSMNFILQHRMERKLKSCVMDWRSPHPTRWSPRCAAMLSEVMQKLERNPASDSIALEIDRLLDTMKDYKVK